MIVFKNPFREEQNKNYIPRCELITFKFKDITWTLSKKYKKIFDRLRSISFKKRKPCLPNKKSNNIIKNIFEQCGYHNIRMKEKLSVYKSNYDETDIYEDFDYVNKYANLYKTPDESQFDYYQNELSEIINNFPKIEDKSAKHEELLKKQIQLILNGYDIIIPDFMINLINGIAEKSCFEDLIEAIKPLKEEMKDLENYDRFSELELLETLQQSLINIDESFNEKTSIFYSLFEYIGKDIFKNTINNLSSIYPGKINLFSKLSYELFQEKMPTSYYPHFHNNTQSNSKEDMSNLLNIIEKDDIDLLQKLFIQCQFDFDKIQIDLSQKNNVKSCYLINNLCNIMECAAFFGSIKCFKFLLLNTKQITKDTSRYAVFGGNAEIIHICESNKCDFNGTLKVAIHSYQNNIANWIIENNKDRFTTDIINECFHACNFQLISTLLNFHEFCPKKEKFFKFLLYVIQHLEKKLFWSEFCVFFTGFPCIEFSNHSGLIYCSENKIKILDILISHYLVLDEKLDLALNNPLRLSAYIGDQKLYNFLLKLGKDDEEKYSEIKDFDFSLNGENDHKIEDDPHYIVLRYEFYGNQCHIYNTLEKNIREELLEEILFLFYNNILIISFYLSPLYYAVISKNNEMIKFLLNQKDKFAFNKPPLYLAAIYDDIEIGNLLLKEYDINSVEKQGHSALMYAIKHGSRNFIDFLLSRQDIDINLQDLIFFLIILMVFIIPFINGIIYIFLFNIPSLFNH